MDIFAVPFYQLTMALFEKGHKKIGGRVKGTPNKVDIQKTRETLAGIIDDYVQNQLVKDLAEMEAKDRAMVLDRYNQYVMPKYQSVESQVAINGQKSLEDELGELANG